MTWGNYVDISEFVGKIFTNIENNEDEIIFTCDNGIKYKMYHEPDCCESVRVEDVCGDFEDILNTPILIAEESTNSDLPKDPEWADESFTWTFYKIDTKKGGVTIRWYGASNGYYSESVDIVRM